MNEVKRPTAWTVFFSVLTLAYLYPIALVVINSFKAKFFISTEPFSLPNADTFVGFDNYLLGIQ